ncbi:MAG: hypothetical protein UZ21_OP11001000634 [Microgenomates bacterium OLB22]|nr:MAG: hypothetical protein UZ21_OP11001000634 [Microgenomates bacterium OLB22]
MLTTGARKPLEVPSGAHYAILIFTTRTIHHEGDERSRTNPGHGYPAWDEQVHELEYIPIATWAELDKQLEQLYKGNYDRKDIVVLEVRQQLQVVVGLKVLSPAPDN